MAALFAQHLQNRGPQVRHGGIERLQALAHGPLGLAVFAPVQVELGVGGLPIAAHCRAVAMLIQYADRETRLQAL